MLNKIMHYNIFPRGEKKMLGRKEMESLWVIWSPNEGMNIAQFIYNQMRRYLEESSVKASLPYPCLITKICLNQKVEKGLNDFLLPSDRGAITVKTMAKTRSQKRDPPSADQPSSSFIPKQVKGSSFHTYMKELMKRIECRVHDCIEG